MRYTEKYIYKKILSVLLCGMLAIPVAAAPNYCELFQAQIRSLRWPVELLGIAEAIHKSPLMIHYLKRYGSPHGEPYRFDPQGLFPFFGIINERGCPAGAAVPERDHVIGRFHHLAVAARAG